jgi:hypothetical protein
MKDISVDIGQLVLDGIGIETRNSQRFGQMTETALMRLVEQRGLPSGIEGGDISEVRVPEMSLPMNAGDRQVAGVIAQAIYLTLSKKG